MRILLYTRIFRLAGSGAEDYAVRLVQGLAARGHDMHVIADDVGDKHIHTHITTYTNTRNIDSVKQQIKPELTLDWAFIAPADIHRMGSGVHAEFMRYSLDAYKGLSRFYKAFRYRKQQHSDIINRQAQLLRNPDAWFLPNSKFCAAQARAGGANPGRIITLHNGVDIDRYTPRNQSNTASATALRRQWGLAESDVIYLFVAHNLRLKNFALLSRAFTQLQGRYPKLKLVIAGKHQPRSLPVNCHYIGMPDDMPTAYRAVDALLHPTYYDSCANVVLEAMSSGLAVIVSDHCGANELIEGSEEGYVLPVTGPSSRIDQLWQSAIQNLGENKKLRNETGIRARTKMLQHSFKHYIDRFDQILQKIKT